MRPSPTLGRLLGLGLLVLAASACGRRGALEAPPDAAAVGPAPARAALVGDAVAVRPGRAPEGRTNAPGQAQVLDGGEALDDPVAASPVPTPARPTARKRGYVVPKDPFILDPLL